MTEIANALRTYNDEWLWEREGELVELHEGRLSSVGVPRLRALANDAVCFQTGEKEFSTVPRELIQSLVSNPTGRFQRLKALLRCPYLGPDFKLRMAGGYDSKTKLALFLHLQLEDELKRIEWKRVEQFVRKLRSFTLKSEPDVVNLLGLYLRPMVQPAYHGPSPETVIVSDAKNSGKTYAFECWSNLLFGYVEKSVPAGATGNEARYQMHGAMSTQPPVMYFDNVASGSTIGGAEKNRLLTSPGPVWIRPVGSKGMHVDPTWMVWISGGNLLELDDEHSRRSVMVQLGPAPDQFEFPRLREDLLADRGHNLCCLLKMVERWVDMGCPPPPKTLSGFEGWSNTVGGVICACFPELAEHWLAESARPVPAVDVALGRLFADWPKLTGTPDPLPVTTILSIIDKAGIEELMEKAGHRTPSSRQARLGKFLRELAASERACGGYRLIMERSGNNRSYWPKPV